MGLFVLGCLIPAFWVSFLATGAMRLLSPRLGLIDRPSARKVHVVPTSLGGGVGIWAGVVIPLAVAQLLIFTMRPQIEAWLPPALLQHVAGAVSRSSELWIILGGGTILAVAGLMDDFRPLPWLPRLVLQLAVSAGVVASGVRASLFVADPWIGGALTVAWCVVLVNSFNFLDNMDGLSSGIGLISSVIFAVMMLSRSDEPRWLVAGFFLVLAGSLIGFLCHNWSPARIFMGDAGSYFLGFTVACMSVLGTYYTEADGKRHAILAPFCVLAVPLYDICSVVFLRLKEGRSPFQPDKRHFSHRLVAMGLTKVQAVLTVHLATLTTGLGGLLLQHVSTWRAAMLIVAMVACVILIIAILEAAPRRADPNHSGKA
jgi:UDP-GlcNAc:undecaprenyl-phosphate GlcNAc-1-phosphate transferase